MARVALFGLPATGKGTMAAALAHEFGYCPLSTGDMIRRMRRDPGPVGDELRALPSWGFADDGLIMRAVTQELLDPKYAKGVVFDGFPRTLAQLEAVDRQGLVIDAAIHLAAPEDMLVERAVSRRVHVASGRVYNVLSSPPKVEGRDDVTGEALVRRDDDREEVLRERFVDYWKKTHPVVEALMKRAAAGAIPFVAVEASGAPEEVWAQARAGLEKALSAGASRKPKMG